MTFGFGIGHLVEVTPALLRSEAPAPFLMANGCQTLCSVSSPGACLLPGQGTALGYHFLLRSIEAQRSRSSQMKVLGFPLGQYWMGLDMMGQKGRDRRLSTSLHSEF